MTQDITDKGLFTNRFAAHILRTLYLEGAMSRADVVSKMPSSGKTLYQTFKVLEKEGYIEAFGEGKYSAVCLTQRGAQAAELVLKLDAMEPSAPVIVDAERLERSIRKAFEDFVGREFPTNLCLSSIVNAVLRDAYPDVNFVPAKRAAYRCDLDVNRPFRGDLMYRTDVIDRYLDRSELPEEALKGSVAVELSGENGDVPKDPKARIWVRAKEVRERNQRMYELRQEMDEIDEDLEELAGQSSEEIVARFKELMTRRMDCEEKLAELSQ